jgi:hypothetical protein
MRTMLAGSHRERGQPVLVHLRMAPKVIPRSRCLRKSTVNTSTGSRNSVVPAAIAGQSSPPSPMMVGMKGGEVCAVPLVSSSAKAYSFQAKIRQKIAVVAMPVAACGSTTLMKGLEARVAVDHRGLLVLARDLVHEALEKPHREREIDHGVEQDQSEVRVR